MLKRRSPDHFRRTQHISRVHQILKRVQASIGDLLQNIPAEGCDCRFENNSPRILSSLCDLNQQMRELTETLVQAGMRHDN